MTRMSTPFELGESLSLRTVLVTGASGFIGSHLCRLLARHGAIVEATSRRDQPPTPSIHRTHVLDLCDTVAVRRLVEQVRPDFVFHLSAITSAARDVDNALPTLHANLVSTVNLLTCVTQVGSCRRVVLAGSLEEQGGLHVPTSPYAASKHAGTQYARMFNALYGTPAAVARIFMVYGPAQPDRRKLIPYVALSLLRRRAPVLSSGERLVDWIYVQDVAEGLARLAIAPGVEGTTVDIGSGVLTSVGDVARQIAALVNNGIDPLLGGIADRRHETVCAADVETTRRLINYVPATCLAEGLRRTVEAYRLEDS
jgi:nucleoside-diphosphate-sugar epimerase